MRSSGGCQAVAVVGKGRCAVGKVQAKATARFFLGYFEFRVLWVARVRI